MKKKTMTSKIKYLLILVIVAQSVVLFWVNSINHKQSKIVEKQQQLIAVYDEYHDVSEQLIANEEEIIRKQGKIIQMYTNYYGY